MTTNMNDTNTNDKLKALHEALDNCDNPKAAIATILMKSGYRFRSYTGKMRWKCAMHAAAEVWDYAYAVMAYSICATFPVRDNEGYIGYTDSFAVFRNGDYYDFHHNKAVRNPQGAIECLMDAERFWRDAMHAAYCVNPDRVPATRNLTWDWEHLFRCLYDCKRPATVRGRSKMRKAVALWQEEIRHRNTKWAIKYE